MRASAGLEIRAAAGVSWRIEGELPSLREQVREACGQSIRRVNRLIQLALIGSGRCARGSELESIYASSIARSMHCHDSTCTSGS